MFYDISVILTEDNNLDCICESFSESDVMVSAPVSVSHTSIADRLYRSHFTSHVI